MTDSELAKLRERVIEAAFHVLLGNSSATPRTTMARLIGDAILPILQAELDAAVRERDEEWIRAMNAEDLQPRNDIEVASYVGWFEASCTHGLEHDVKARNETIRKLRDIAGAALLVCEFHRLDGQKDGYGVKLDEAVDELRALLAEGEARHDG